MERCSTCLQARASGWKAGLMLGFALLGACANQPPTATGMLDQRFAEGDPLVVAHRACWRQAAENSFAAMDICIANGVDMLEIDVRQTADGELVVIHDATLDRTTEFHGAVGELPASQVIGLRLRDGLGGPDAPVTDERLPSLDATLQHLKNRVLINLDVKDKVLSEVIAKVVARDMADQVMLKAVVDAPDHPHFYSAEALQGLTFMPIIRHQNGDPAEQIARFAGSGVKAFEVIYTNEAQLQAACTAAQKIGARCWVNTMWHSLSPGHVDDDAYLDPDAHWGLLRSLGVSIFQSDRPLSLLGYLQSGNLRSENAGNAGALSAESADLM